MSRCRFTLVHRDNTRQCTNTETSDKTANSDLIPFGVRRNLDDDTNDVNHTPNGNRQFPSESVGERSSAQCTNHGSDGELEHVNRFDTFFYAYEWH
jgi:hypothetical protein